VRKYQREREREGEGEGEGERESQGASWNIHTQSPTLIL